MYRGFSKGVLSDEDLYEKLKLLSYNDEALYIV